MKKQWFGILFALAVMLALIPAGGVMASGDTKWTGTIESLPATPGWIGDWVVNGKTIHVSNTTKIDQEHGAVAVGATAKAEGYLQADGSLNAKEIEIKSGSNSGNYKLKGIIESLPATPDYIGDWVVSGVTVHVTSATKMEFIKKLPAVGKRVEIKGLLLADNTVNATKIEVKK